MSFEFQSERVRAPGRLFGLHPVCTGWLTTWTIHRLCDVIFRSIRPAGAAFAAERDSADSEIEVSPLIVKETTARDRLSGFDVFVLWSGKDRGQTDLPGSGGAVLGTI